MSRIEERLRSLGLALPPPPSPGGTYVPVRRSGNLLHLFGVGPQRGDGSYVRGKLGRDLTQQEGYEAARLCGLALLANLRGEIGDLDEVGRFVKVVGMVNGEPDFEEVAAVVNGCSDLLGEVFGEAGRHARTSLGVATLPGGIAVEVDAIVEVG